jgi:hypothetical protein
MQESQLECLNYILGINFLFNFMDSKTLTLFSIFWESLKK